MQDIVHDILECTRCPLSKTRIQAVAGSGPVPARLMLIGEAPGKNEDELGMPFSGAAGKVLDTMLVQAGLRREAVFITSVVKCRPPKNRNPKSSEVAACLDHLHKQIQIVQPQLIAVMGNVALQALLDCRMTISKMHGQIVSKDGLNFMPVYHPAAVLYNRTLEPYLRDDFLKLASLSR